MKQKHFMDIENLREEDTDLRQGNGHGFVVGDIIQITTKIDGSNASIAYDKDTESVVSFSRKKKLDYTNTLNGFWNYTQSQNINNIYNNIPKQYVVFGEWMCLSGDTVIAKTSGGKNSRHMTLKEMYDFYTTPSPDEWHYSPNKGRTNILNSLLLENGLTEDQLYEKYETVTADNKTRNRRDGFQKSITYNMNCGYIEMKNDKYYITDFGEKEFYDYLIRNNWWHRNGLPSIYSLFLEEDKIHPNKIRDIIYSGKKDVYQVITRKGYYIKSTLNHKFFTPKGFVKLEDLGILDCVAVTEMCNSIHNRYLGKGSFEIKKRQMEYKEKIGRCEICGNETCLELHHKDGNYLNNDESNFQVLCKDCHSKVHNKKPNRNKVGFDYEFDYIIDISYVGEEDCYDIMMEGDENTANFVASGFIVHNCKHKVIYDQDFYKKWYVYDVYDKENEKWMEQSVVKTICENENLNYINELYYGPFISWGHVRSFLDHHWKSIGNEEGIIVKNQSRLNCPDTRLPFYLKIVNDDFKESMKTREKVIDPAVEAAKSESQRIVESIVTKNRVEKELFKMRDEGILPEKLAPTDMGLVARYLPKRIYDDCVKEEKELVIAAGEYFGKMCSSQAMKLAREIVAGSITHHLS